MAMIRLSFTPEDREELRSLSLHHPHPFVRRKSLALHLKSQDIAHGKIAAITGLCMNTVTSYLKGYRDHGMSFITAINFNQPHSSLERWDDALKAYIDRSPPHSIAQACAEIAALTGVTLKETQMRHHLKRLGVRYRKVCGIPSKADIAAQAAFTKEKLEPRLQEAQAGKRTVYFVDAAHFVLGAFLGMLWSFTRVFVKTPSGRQRFNVLGALNAVTRELLTVTNDTYITGTQVCELLRLIRAKTAGNITLVLDNARYQRCKIVTALATKLGIELLFLPPYSPNLNLIERVWKFTKKKCLTSKYYPDFNSFRTAISNTLATMHSVHKMELESLLALRFQVFKEEHIMRATY
jgi:transposase